MARIMKGATLGLDAMTSVDQIFVIGERFGMFARMMHALVLTRSVCEEFEILEEQSTDKIAKVRAKRRGDREATTFAFTIEEAAKLVGDAKMKDPESNYNKDRKGMLIAKVVKRAIDRKFPDVIAGFEPYEDLRETVTVNATTGEVRVQKPGQLTAAPTRDFESEFAAIIEAIDAAKDDEAFQFARKSITDWTAPEDLKKKATTKYNEARKAWKASSTDPKPEGS